MLLSCTVPKLLDVPSEVLDIFGLFSDDSQSPNSGNEQTSDKAAWSGGIQKEPDKAHWLPKESPSF